MLLLFKDTWKHLGDIRNPFFLIHIGIPILLLGGAYLFKINNWILIASVILGILYETFCAESKWGKFPIPIIIIGIIVANFQPSIRVPFIAFLLIYLWWLFLFAASVLSSHNISRLKANRLSILGASALLIFVSDRYHQASFWASVAYITVDYFIVVYLSGREYLKIKMQHLSHP